MLRLPIVLAVLVVVAATPTPTNPTPRGKPQTAIEFYKQVVKAKPGNVIVSPFSVKVALSLLSLAANGKTFEDLSRVWNLPSDKTQIADLYHQVAGVLRANAGNATLASANQIYVQQDHKLNKHFQELALEKFGSGVESVNFADTATTALQINHFVAENTHDKIQELVTPDSISPETSVFLVNAIYLKAAWEKPFAKTSTSEGTFHISDTEKVPIDFMWEESHFNYAALKHWKATALEQKYADSKFSFVIILPDEDSNLTELESHLNGEELTQIPFESREVNAKIPKFSVEYDIKLNDVLKEFGLEGIFSDEADLSGLLEDSHTKLKVSDVIHKTFINVYEAGTEAAGVTGLGIVPMSLTLPPPPNFFADRPFFYFIQDREEKVILFSGRLVHPTK